MSMIHTPASREFLPLNWRSKMPIFSRSSFRTPRKPVRRKGGSLPNISQLDDTAFSVDSLRLDGGPVTMKLGGHEFIFDDGHWVIGGSQEQVVTREQTQLQKEYVQVLEANNLLRYKMELLLDMLAASNADCLVLQRELNALKKPPQSPQKK